MTDTTSDRGFCVTMLPHVSRTFALGIRLLPSALEFPVLASYLLCRIADTIEDAAQLSPADKSSLLAHFSACLDDDGADAAPLRQAFDAPRSAEERLAHDADRVLREYRRFPDPDRDAIRPFVQEMAAGMAEFAERHGDGNADGLRVLQNVDELDRYCYYVAGTVGHLLTGLFHLHEPAIDAQRRDALAPLAPRFGLGLQLTNIIKDVADDRRRGWSFVPRDLCAGAGVAPEQLQQPEYAVNASRVMHALIDRARGYLEDALRYCTTLPAGAYRVRIFCLTSLYLAVRTLHRAARDPRLLDPAHKVKITRRDVYRTVATTHVVAPFDGLVRRYYRALAASG